VSLFLCQLIDRTLLQRLIGFEDRRFDHPRRLEPCVGGTFSCAVHTHQRFEEMPVCKLPRR
jgi:hypothetical protein